MTGSVRFVLEAELPPAFVAAPPTPLQFAPSPAQPFPLHPLPRVPLVPPLEPHFRLPPEPGHRHRLDKYALALQVDARLALRASIEHRVERARAAVARALLEARAHEAAGYTNLRDYAREELGLSLRSLQDLARLDRALAGLPRMDAAVGSGRLAPSRVLAVLPVATAENEAFWLAQASHRTYRQLVQRVRVALETRPDPPERQEARQTQAGEDRLDPDRREPEAMLLQRKPPRSQFLWEAFVEEASRTAGRNLGEGEALEILLAEFWTLVPPSLTEALPPTELGPGCRPTGPTAAPLSWRPCIEGATGGASFCGGSSATTDPGPISSAGRRPMPWISWSRAPDPAWWKRTRSCSTPRTFRASTDRRWNAVSWPFVPCAGASPWTKVRSSTWRAVFTSTARFSSPPSDTTPGSASGSAAARPRTGPTCTGSSAASRRCAAPTCATG